jgi:ubiquinone biosynthesis protein
MSDVIRQPPALDEDPPGVPDAAPNEPPRPRLVMSSGPSGVMARIQVPRLLEVDPADHVAPPMMKRLVYSASALQVVARLFAWMGPGLALVAGLVWDFLRRRAAPERRAVRIRKAIERVGGTFIKIGQQMAVRVDLLPMVYCDELAKMLDQVPPFQLDYAVARIEAATGRPLLETFAVFDPVPIGSASVACVYQAILNNGDHVAVKVRRPDIGRIFASDLRALQWIVAFAEFLTITRPGLMRHAHHELRSMLMEELDFRREARYTDLFRRRAIKRKHRFLHAPHVHFALSNDEVLVTEFIEGVPLGAVVAAVEGSDDDARRRLAELDIDPRLVARRLIWASNFGIHESLLFHADPHPANVIVRPRSELVFIDFGSCGTYMKRERELLARVQYAQNQQDVAGMVRASIALMEPLPPIDSAELEKRAEYAWWQALLATKARGVEWWERTSAGIWISFLQVTREYEIPLNLNTLRMIRATLLYDTLAARLDPQIDIFKIYRRFARARDRRDRKRARRRFFRAVRRFRSDDIFLFLERARASGVELVQTMEDLLDSTRYRFAAMTSKSTYAVNEIIAFAGRVATVAAVSLGSVLLYDFLRHHHIDLWSRTVAVVSHKAFVAVALLLTFQLARRLHVRFLDRDETPEQGQR